MTMSHRFVPTATIAIKRSKVELRDRRPRRPKPHRPRISSAPVTVLQRWMDLSA
jgi:hypothetical protein